MSKPVVYLAGAMERAPDGGRQWREEITPHLEQRGYDVWNPCTEEMNVGISIEELAELKKSDFSEFRKYCSRIVEYDLTHLVKCSLVVCKIDIPTTQGAGTFGELTVCHLYNVPVYAWIDHPKGIKGIPGWAVGCLTSYTESKDSFYNMIPDSAATKTSENVELRQHIENYVKEWETHGFCDKQ